MKNNSKIGILGFGEVGQAIAKFYKSAEWRTKIKDIKRNDGLGGVEILNICIPFNNKFLRIVEKEIKAINPKLTIIHSTVAVGTTKKLAKMFRGAVVHSPIRGVHPHLHEGIKTFVKYIGADNEKYGKMAGKHLKSLGIKTKLVFPSKTSELAKLFDTTYYGLCIAWHGEMKKICGKENISFNDAVTEFNKTYNEGYSKLRMKNVVRPVLYPPKGRIGGHCILPNAKILKKYYKSKAVDLILGYTVEN